MRIVISSGHGLLVRGASGYIDEVDEARRVVDRVAGILNDHDIPTIVFHDNTSTTQSENLNTIVNFHNHQERDLDVSVHFNCYETTNEPRGVEVLWTSTSAKLVAIDTSDAISIAGQFINRGAKERNDLAFLNNTEETAILIETCFVDSKADVNNYHLHFENICHAIAEAISIPISPPERPDRPPETIPVESRPELSEGDTGPDVRDLQMLLPRFGMGNVDGDFGPYTDSEVRDYQQSRGLTVDGIVGQQTWIALYENRPPIPSSRPPHALHMRDQVVIIQIANNSAISNYYWQDRGVAPTGYTQGMALAFAQTYLKLKHNHPAAVEMSKARKDSDKDALNIYKDEFNILGMDNEEDGPNTLRHLYALMLGHGMRESSGRHCEGRDRSADNVQSDTAEAGLFQTSYNAHSSSDPEFSNLMEEYSNPQNEGTCYFDAFAEDVECSEDDWDCYGSGQGYDFQKLCKDCPAFSVETAALTLRNLCNHYGPIIRQETELRADADHMFKTVQDYVDEIEPVVV
jgi:hypothetical protein